MQPNLSGSEHSASFLPSLPTFYIFCFSINCFAFFFVVLWQNVYLVLVLVGGAVLVERDAEEPEIVFLKLFFSLWEMK